MSTGLNLEIWFPQQDEVTVFLESSITDPEEEQFAETCLFALYAARQIVNLRGAGHFLAGLLLTADTDDPLRRVEESLGEVRVISSRSRGGHKGFTAEVRPARAARVAFKLKAHGFGMLGRDVGDYSTTSTGALLYWLLNRRKDNPTYQRALAAAAVNIGSSRSNGRLTITSQGEVAVQAAGDAWAEAIAAGKNPKNRGIDAPEWLDVDALPFFWGALVSSAIIQMPEMVENGHAGEMFAFPADLAIPFCRLQVLAAAGLADDERVTCAYAAVETAVDAATRETANNYLNSVLASVAEESDLLPAADALYQTLFADDAEHAAQGQG